MPRAQLTNNASTTLATGISSVATSLTVATGAGALFPAPGTDYFYVTLKEGTLIEIVKVTARTGDVFTVTRAQDNTTAQTFTAAATVKLSLTAAVLAELQEALVSATNIKTVNGTSLLGAGDLVVGGGGVALGATVTTSEVLAAPNYLLCDGAAYLQSTYPALYGVVGLLPDPPEKTPVSWTTNDTLPASLYWKAVAFGNGVFVAIGNNTATTARSTDGVTWALGGNTPSSQYWNHLFFVNGLFYVVNNSGFSASSPDGTTWTDRGTPTIASGNQRMVYSNTTLVLMSSATSDGRVATSTDGGVSWTARSLISSLGLSGLAFGNGVLVASVSSTTTNTAFRSTDDGVTWSAVTLPVGKSWAKIAFGNGIFVMPVNNAAEALVSRDGLNWKLVTTAGDTGIVNIIFAEGTFFAFSPAGISHSYDGVKWNYSAAAYVANMNYPAYGKGKLVLVTDLSPYTSAPYVKLAKYDIATHFVVPNIAPASGTRTYIKTSA